MHILMRLVIFGGLCMPLDMLRPLGLTKWMFSDEFMDMITATTLHITPEMLRLIAQIDEFKGAWRALGILAPERLTALRKVATIESVGSSTRIEGGKLSDREVESLLANLSIQTLPRATNKKLPGMLKPWNRFFNRGNIWP